MSIRQVAVVGAGTMGAGITQVSATAGYEVPLLEINKEQLRRGMKVIEQSLSKFAEKKKITEAVPVVPHGNL